MQEKRYLKKKTTGRRALFFFVIPRETCPEETKGSQQMLEGERGTVSMVGGESTPSIQFLLLLSLVLSPQPDRLSYRRSTCIIHQPASSSSLKRDGRLHFHVCCQTIATVFPLPCPRLVSAVIFENLKRIFAKIIIGKGM